MPPSKPPSRSRGFWNEDGREQHRRPDEPARVRHGAGPPPVLGPRQQRADDRAGQEHPHEGPRPFHAGVGAGHLPHERAQRGRPREPAHRSDGPRDPRGRARGEGGRSVAGWRRPGRGRRAGTRRTGRPRAPCAVSSGAVSDARTSISSTPRTAKTPQVRRHHARPRPERAYPPASPNVTTPIAPPPIPWVISSLKIVGSASAARNRHGERVSHQAPRPAGPAPVLGQPDQRADEKSRGQDQREGAVPVDADASPAIWTIQPRRAAAQVSPTAAPAATSGRAGRVATTGALIAIHPTSSARTGTGPGHSSFVTRDLRLPPKPSQYSTPSRLWTRSRG